MDCYKHESHSECSEEFYKQNIQDELTLRSQEDGNASRNKIYEILNRINNEDFLYDDEDDIEEIDSDDDADEDIASRLQGIDINDSEDIWKHLTEEERQEFQKLVNNGEIFNLIPDYKPWWEQNKVLVQEVGEETKKKLPDIYNKIPDFEKLTSKPVSPCLHFNICNILGSYTILTRFYNGEHHTNPLETVKYFLTFSKTLKSNENFDNYETCLESILKEIEDFNLDLGVEYEDINKDLQIILISPGGEYILRALSDVYKLFSKAKKVLIEGGEKKEKSEFCKRFGPEPKCDVTKSSINLILKKMEFLMASVVKSNK